MKTVIWQRADSSHFLHNHHRAYLQKNSVTWGLFTLWFQTGPQDPLPQSKSLTKSDPSQIPLSKYRKILFSGACAYGANFIIKHILQLRIRDTSLLSIEEFGGDQFWKSKIDCVKSLGHRDCAELLGSHQCFCDLDGASHRRDTDDFPIFILGLKVSVLSIQTLIPDARQLCCNT